MGRKEKVDSVCSWHGLIQTGRKWRSHWMRYSMSRTLVVLTVLQENECAYAQNSGFDLHGEIDCPPQSAVRNTAGCPYNLARVLPSTGLRSRLGWQLEVWYIDTYGRAQVKEGWESEHRHGCNHHLPVETGAFARTFVVRRVVEWNKRQIGCWVELLYTIVGDVQVEEGSGIRKFECKRSARGSETCQTCGPTNFFISLVGSLSGKGDSPVLWEAIEGGHRIITRFCC